MGRRENINKSEKRSQTERAEYKRQGRLKTVTARQIL